MLLASMLLGWCYVNTRGMLPGCSAGVPPGSEMSPAQGGGDNSIAGCKGLIAFFADFLPIFVAMAKWLCALQVTSLLVLKGSPKPCLG